MFRKPPTQTLQADTERIVQLTQVEDPDSVQKIVQFREAVKQKLENLSTTQEIGSVSTIVQSIAARHFPRTTQTTPTVARWQQPGIKQGIADMWKAWIHYRRSSRDIMLQALIGRWRTWAQYTKLSTNNTRTDVEPLRKPIFLSACRRRSRLPNSITNVSCIRLSDHS